jgi:transcription elongation factor GreA
MAPALTPDLLRSLGLDVDGPARWGSLPASQAPGIFAVETNTPFASAPLDQAEIRRWLERVPGLRIDGEPATPTLLARRLASFWVPGEALLYVGRTSRSLAARVASLYATELGHRRPHAGGHWLKTLQDQPRLRLWWAETDAPEEYEDALMGAFADAVPSAARSALPSGAPVLPWASLESPSGARRDTGIQGSLRDTEDPKAEPPAVRRSDRSASIRRRMPSNLPAPVAPRLAAARSTTRSAKAAADRPSPTHLTEDGLAGLQAELERLRTVERPAVVERIKHARELGDLRENADYEAARREQSFLEGRIQQLEHQLRTAVVIRANTARTSIALGSRVGYEVDGVPGSLTIVGSTESDPGAGLISAVSPVGRALLGRRVGDDVVVTTPGAQVTYRITEVG